MGRGLDSNPQQPGREHGKVSWPRGGDPRALESLSWGLWQLPPGPSFSAHLDGKAPRWSSGPQRQFLSSPPLLNSLLSGLCLHLIPEAVTKVTRSLCAAKRRGRFSASPLAVGRVGHCGPSLLLEILATWRHSLQARLIARCSRASRPRLWTHLCLPPLGEPIQSSKRLTIPRFIGFMSPAHLTSPLGLINFSNLTLLQPISAGGLLLPSSHLG